MHKAQNLAVLLKNVKIIMLYMDLIHCIIQFIIVISSFFRQNIKIVTLQHV